MLLLTRKFLRAQILQNWGGKPRKDEWFHVHTCTPPVWKPPRFWAVSFSVVFNIAKNNPADTLTKEAFTTEHLQRHLPAVGFQIDDPNETKEYNTTFFVFDNLKKQHPFLTIIGQQQPRKQPLSPQQALQ